MVSPFLLGIGVGPEFICEHQHRAFHLFRGFSDRRARLRRLLHGLRSALLWRLKFELSFLIEVFKFELFFRYRCICSNCWSVLSAGVLLCRSVTEVCARGALLNPGARKRVGRLPVHRPLLSCLATRLARRPQVKGGAHV